MSEKKTAYASPTRADSQSADPIVTLDLEQLDNSRHVVDLAVGWDAVYAMHQSAVNNALRGMHSSGIIPAKFDQKFSFKRERLVLDIEPDLVVGVPRIVDGSNRCAEIEVPISGDLLVKLAGKRVRAYEASEGCALLVFDMSTLDISIAAKVGQDQAEGNGKTAYVLSIALVEGATIKDVNLSNLAVRKTFPPRPRDIDLSEYEEDFLAAIDEMVKNVDWPLEFEFSLGSNVVLNETYVHSTYTNIPGDPEKNLFGILLSDGTAEGDYDLHPDTIPPGRSDQDTSFIVSNRLMMRSVLAGLSNVVDENGDSLNLSPYPHTVDNTEYLKGKAKPHWTVGNIQWRIPPFALRSLVLPGQERFSLLISRIDFKKWYHLRYFYKKNRIDIWAFPLLETPRPSLQHAESVLIIRVDCDVNLTWKIPWPLNGIIRRLIEDYVRRDIRIKIPGFVFDAVLFPAHLQVLGKWASTAEQKA